VIPLPLRVLKQRNALAFRAKYSPVKSVWPLCRMWLKNSSSWAFLSPWKPVQVTLRT
jgi:hypothetical protein